MENDDACIAFLASLVFFSDKYVVAAVLKFYHTVIKLAHVLGKSSTQCAFNSIT